MNELHTLFKGSLRRRNGYSSNRDPLARWKDNMINLALKHQREAKSGGQAPRRSWHELQPDGRYINTVRLNHCPLGITGQNCWEMATLDDVVKFYDVVIGLLKDGALDRDILNTALTIKSMRREALSILESRFPEALEPEEIEEASNDLMVAEEPHQPAIARKI
jgi:hypothetical protein